MHTSIVVVNNIIRPVYCAHIALRSVIMIVMTCCIIIIRWTRLPHLLDKNQWLCVKIYRYLIRPFLFHVYFFNSFDGILKYMNLNFVTSQASPTIISTWPLILLLEKMNNTNVFMLKITYYCIIIIRFTGHSRFPPIHFSPKSLGCLIRFSFKSKKRSISQTKFVVFNYFLWKLYSIIYTW